MQHEQIDLFSELEFDTSEERLSFHVSYQDENWKSVTHTVDGIKGIVKHESLKLSIEELKEICRRAIRVKRIRYGYLISYKDHDERKELFVRFSNYTTKNKEDVFAHIDLYFQMEYKKSSHYLK